MRLWHKDLINYLPRQQLISQWRECCLIAHEWADLRTPNHILVNEVLNYPISHFVAYCNIVYKEMIFRNYRLTDSSTNRLNRNILLIDRGEHHKNEMKVEDAIISTDIFPNWHNDRYLLQCYFNLEEKYDRGGITDAEWSRIDDYVSNRLEYLL